MPRAAGVPLDPPLITVRVPSNQLLATDALEPMFPGVDSAPLYDAAQLQTLDDLVVRAQQRSPRYQPPDFRALHRIILPQKQVWAADAPQRNLAAQLRRIMLDLLPIDYASVETRLSPLPVKDGASGDELGHLDPAPKGIGVESVWGEPGGTGKGEALADVERGWHVDHEEFNGVSHDLLPGGEQVEIWVPHGTQVLATALARMNSKYGVGVAREAVHMVLASELRTSGSYDLPATLLEAIAALVAFSPGSVLLIELQKLASDFDSTIKSGVQGPVEMDLAVFQEIQLAVANHIVVVEAAGNGGTSSVGVGLNLDDHADLLYGDSGAIMVGESEWNSATGHEAIAHCVTGKRINCFSWGKDIYAASSSELGVSEVTGKMEYKDDFTTGFGGTSAAAAIIAGSAMVVQGMVRAGAAGSLAYLNPMQMRALLGDDTEGVNTPLASGDTDVIGVQPDLKQIGVQLGVLPDLYIRDSVGDTGGPHTDVLSKSPDIILKTPGLGSVAAAKALFGEGSGAEDDDDLSDKIVAGATDAELFVRVRNGGGKDVTGATVTVAYAHAGTLLTPADWTDIGSATVDVPMGHEIAIAGPIPWTDLPDPGHYCFIARVTHPQDALFTPDVFADVDAYKAYVRRENNVAWRNFNVEAASGGGTWTFTSSIAGDPGGAPDSEEPMEIEVEARLPKGATLEVELPAAVRGRMSLPAGAAGSSGRIKLSPVGLGKLGVAHLPARKRYEVKLHVDTTKATLPAAARYEVALIQRHGGSPLGRVTWRLELKKPATGGGPAPGGNAPPTT